VDKMDVYEITGYQTGVSDAGVNYLQPSDSFQNIENGFIYRQVLQSRFGFTQFSTSQLTGVVPDKSRVMGIFEFVHRDNTIETLAVTKNFLYSYNEGTDTFDQITMAGSAPAGGFAIASNEYYVSGTSYPEKDGSDRFLFTGIGMTDIWSYDPGTASVTSFTLDNADFDNPPEGTLTNAWFILWFGERLNVFNPTIGGFNNPQSFFYSGIRETSGNGDKFNVSGAGFLGADTSEYINGMSILGDKVILNFSRSSWSVEKTRDAFNPYFIRKIPSVLGTDAPFSAVGWSDEIKSLGKTGIIITDGRESGRCDNKIPFFTQDEMSSEDFDLSYGGFDRINDQFLFSYKSNATDEDDHFQDRVLVNNYGENSWSVYDMRFSVFGQTTSGQNLVWDDIFEDNNPSWLQWDTTEEIWDKIGINGTVQKTLAGDDQGFVYQLNQGYDDYSVGIETSITQAAQAVVTTTEQSLKAGDLVVISGVSGMTEINNFDPSNPLATFKPYTVISATETTVTLNVNSTNFTAYTSDGLISKVITFKAETIPFNPYRANGRKCRVSYVEFLLDANGGSLLVDVISDEEKTPFKKDVPIQTTSTAKSREWVSMSVNQESNFLTFVLKQESPSVQMRLTNMRIHCQPGGFTS